MRGGTFDPIPETRVIEMEVVLTVKDDIYPKREIIRTRYGARGIILDEDDNVAVLRIKGDDVFGSRDHYELPGGGQEEGEKILDTFLREMEEEVGVTVKDIVPLGVVEYEYNLLLRREYSHYFLARKDRAVPRKLTEMEASFFSELCWINIDELIRILKTEKVENVGILIHRREAFMLERAKKVLEKRSNKK